MADLSSLQTKINRDLPVVFYEGSERCNELKPFKERAVQPHPGLIEYTQARSVEELVDRTKRLGATGFCIDTHHLRRGQTFLSRNWRGSLEQILPETQEVHVSVGRIRSGDPQIDTMAELSDLRNGTNDTEIRHILRFIGERWKGRVVVEVEADAYGKMITSSEFSRVNKQLVFEIGTLMA